VREGEREKGNENGYASRRKGEREGERTNVNPYFSLEGGKNRRRKRK